jgi:2-polyprenyl-6-methoxyphenol hydroxylase-like FAD-dependent oxidoreductase
MTAADPRHRVIVVGGGFGGLQAVRAMSDLDAEITLIDRHNYHLFQPLSYQVATGALSPGEIAVRRIFRIACSMGASIRSTTADYEPGRSSRNVPYPSRHANGLTLCYRRSTEVTSVLISGTA